MKEQLITFETAKLAKEKGFDIQTRDCYAETHKHSWDDPRSGECVFDYIPPRILPTENTYNDKWISVVCKAPTQSLLQKWLREKHGIFCEVKIGLQHNDFMFSSYIVTKDGRGYKFRSNFYDTYEEALELGLQEALKLIENKK